MLSSIIPRGSLDACMASRACSHACHAWCCSVPLMIVPPSLLSAPRCAQQSSPPASVALPWHGDGFGATGAQNREHSLTWISLPLVEALLCHLFEQQELAVPCID